MRHLLLLAFPLLLSTFVSAAPAPASTPLGGWEDIGNLQDPHIHKIAHFAISTHNKQESKNLIFKRVVSGKQQVVAGMNYKLDLMVKDGDLTLMYQAIVFEPLMGRPLQLTSFRPLPFPGGWTEIEDLNDPAVQKVAKFAATVCRRKNNTSTTTQVVNGWLQVVDGVQYKLVLNQTDEQFAPTMFEAMVLERARENLMQLISCKLMSS